MNSMKNSTKSVSEREFMFAFPSIVIGVSVLSLPSDVAKVTEFSDGWISILIAGILATLLAVSCVKLALNFRKLSFIEYMSTLVTKPIATCIALYYVGISILVSASINRSVASIAQQFLFERTPLAVIALAFLLVVIYAVAGSRIGIFRLNILFLPIILFVFLFVGLLNIPMIESVNFLPLFQTNIKGYVKGLFGSIPAFSGFGLGIFYVFLVGEQQNLMKKTMIGMSISIVFYLYIFLITVGVFGNIVISNLTYPTLDLAKRVDIPGAIFERIDAIVYTIWTMAIFNSMTLFLDSAVLLLTTTFKHMNKQIVLFILAPIIYFIALLPREVHQMEELWHIISIITIISTPTLLLGSFLLIKIKEGKRKNV